MTRLKSLSIPLAALILLISIISCKSDEGSSATDPVSTSLVGTWILTKITLKSGTSSLSLTPAQAQIESTIIAKADGSYTATTIQNGITTITSGSYATDGKVIIFKDQAVTTTTTEYTLSKNTLVVVQTITALGVESPADLEFTRQ